MRRNIKCSVGTGQQFEKYLENLLDGDVGVDIQSSVQTFSEGHIKDLISTLGYEIGTRLGAQIMYSVNLGDGTFGFIYQDNENGEFHLLDSSSNEIAIGYDDVYQYVSNSWGGSINSATNTSNIPGNPEVIEANLTVDDPEFLEVYSELLNTFNAKGYDSNSEDVAEYCRNAAEYILMSPEPYSVSQWWEDTQMNYPQDLENLPMQASTNIEASEEFRGGYPTDDYLWQLGDGIKRKLIEKRPEISCMYDVSYGELELEMVDQVTRKFRTDVITAEQIDTESSSLDEYIDYFVEEILSYFVA